MHGGLERGAVHRAPRHRPILAHPDEHRLLMTVTARGTAPRTDTGSTVNASPHYGQYSQCIPTLRVVQSMHPRISFPTFRTSCSCNLMTPSVHTHPAVTLYSPLLPADGPSDPTNPPSSRPHFLPPSCLQMTQVTPRKPTCGPNGRACPLRCAATS